jgi:hypothetical protein
VYLKKESEFAKSIDGHTTHGIILRIKVWRGEEEGKSNLKYMSIT